MAIKQHLYAFGVLAALALAACGQSKPSSVTMNRRNKPDTFRIAVTALEPVFRQNGEALYFHPHYGLTGWTGYFTHEQLIDYSGEFGLAKSISISQDEKEAVVELPKGALFHDGSELTADDVIYSLDSLKKAERDKSKHTFFDIYHHPIVDCVIAKLDNHKVAIRAERPIDYRNALQELDIINNKSRKIFEMDGRPVLTPDGTGPYQIANYNAEKKLFTLTANPAYRLGAPAIKKIEISLFKTIDAASLALLTNKADYTPVFGKMVREMLGNPGDFTIFPYEHNYCQMLLFNTSHPILRDARLRRALSLLLDRNHLAKHDDTGPAITKVPTATFLNLSHPKTTPVSEPVDGMQVARLATEAGLKIENGKLLHKGKRLSLTIFMLHPEMTDHAVQTIRKIVKMWENGGIFCDFKIIDDIGKIRKRDFDVLFISLLEHKSVPMTMGAVYKLDGGPSLFDLELPDSQLKELINSLRNETRQDVLLEKKLAIQQRIKETSPLIPLYYETGYGALGWEPNSNEDIKKALSKDPAVFSYMARLR